MTPHPIDKGLLIVFEGLDQSGKQTQAERLRERLVAGGRVVRPLSFPDYDTVIGGEISRALRGECHYGPDVMQLLYVANRYEWKREIVNATALGTVVVCDRYLASSVAYGEAQGLDPAWLEHIQEPLPEAALTVLLDLSPSTAAERKRTGRDRFERDLALLARVRESYRRQAVRAGWVVIDAAPEKEVVAGAVTRAVLSRLAPPSAPERS
jgi:dTMP kinase